jgi:small nuclear ribonucleoprotein (snRNP)-like protein
MNSASVSANMRISKRDGLWLAMAVLVHALILLIPMQSGPPPVSKDLAISVSLMRPPQVSAEQQEEVLPKHEETPPVPNEPERVEHSSKPAQLVAEVEDAAEASVAASPPVISAARLIDAARNFKWPQSAKKSTRQLGLPHIPALPENWRPGIAHDDNLFDGMTLPGKTEVLDRWLAADGSRNVVVETRSGHTFCGRQQAWDPMNPLLENVMMFRPCAGGGKRQFRMPKRYQGRRDFLQKNNESALR